MLSNNCLISISIKEHLLVYIIDILYYLSSVYDYNIDAYRIKKNDFYNDYCNSLLRVIYLKNLF